MSTDGITSDQVNDVVDRVTAHVEDVRGKVHHTECDAEIDRRDAEIDALREENRLARLKMGFENLTREQTQQLLDFFMYRLSPDLREKLAATLPVAYNAWCGFDVVQVVSVKDPTRNWTAE